MWTKYLRSITCHCSHCYTHNLGLSYNQIGFTASKKQKPSVQKCFMQMRISSSKKLETTQQSQSTGLPRKLVVAHRKGRNYISTKNSNRGNLVRKCFQLKAG